MQIRFEGKRVLVAGGSRGIGRSVALAFARCGASVAICARSEDALRATERGRLAHAWSDGGLGSSA